MRPHARVTIPAPRGGGSAACAAALGGRPVQKKSLRSSPSSDRLEREADLVAERMGPAPLAAGAATPAANAPLDASTRSFMERRLGHQFSAVRVHADGEAAARAEALSARAFTRGRDIFFGAGQYDPTVASGQALIAHELAHVVQQETGAAAGVQCAPDTCQDAAGDPVDVAQVAEDAANDASADSAKLPDLYLALKRARACAGLDQATFAARFTAAPSLYDAHTRKALRKEHHAKHADDLELAWKESTKPFAGYVMSGYDTANRFTSRKNLRKLGATLAPSHEKWREFSDDPSKAQSAFSEATVLVFSGHQYAQYKLPGVWDVGKPGTVLDVRGIQGPLPNVKLLVSTSCATLCTEAYEVWKDIFPNAVFLGAARSTPTKGGVLANAFVKSLPKDLLMDPGASGVSDAIAAWKAAVERTQSERVEGGVLDIAANSVEVWKGKRKGWVTRAADAQDNACKVKDDYSDAVPDPR
jgi:hypothetical protein